MRYRKRKEGASQTLTAAVIVFFALSVLVVLASSQVFRVRSIMVVGNRNLTQEQIIEQSGVTLGDNLLSVSETQMKNQLEKNRYIRYVSRQFDYKGTLTIRISERLGMGVVNVLGLYYVLDASGMVLECTGSAYPDEVAGPKITGLNMDNNTRVTVGMELPVRDSVQLENMEHVLRMLDAVNLLGRIATLDVKNTENLNLMTNDGSKISLGNSDDLQVKLLIAREVLTVREPMGDLQGAKIDVSSGKNAHYIPNTLPTVTPVPTLTPEPTAQATPT